MKPDIQALIDESIRKNNETEPVAKQMLFDQKVKEAETRLEIFAKEQIQQIERKKTLFWRRITFAMLFLNVILLIASPWEIALLVAADAQKDVIDPAVKQSLDEIVKNNSSQYVDTQLGPFKQTVDDLHNRLINLSGTISEAQKVSTKAEQVTGNLQQQAQGVGTKLNLVNESLNIVALVVRADNDDREAFEKLFEIAKAQGPGANIAGEVIVSLISNNGIQIGYDAPWKYIGVTNPESLKLDEIKDVYIKQRRLDFKKGILSYIWSSAKYSKFKKLEFIMWVIQNDRSLSTTTYALGIADTETKIKHNVLDTKSYIDWWNNNKENYRAQVPFRITPPSSVPTH